MTIALIIIASAILATLGIIVSRLSEIIALLTLISEKDFDLAGISDIGARLDSIERMIRLTVPQSELQKIS